MMTWGLLWESTEKSFNSWLDSRIKEINHMRISVSTKEGFDKIRYTFLPSNKALLAKQEQMEDSLT